MFLNWQHVIRGTTALTRQILTGRGFIPRIQVGDMLPEAELLEDYLTVRVKIPEFTAKKQIILFGVPGAFCPGCSMTHLPGFLSRAEKMKAAGFDEIISVSVNDPYVMAAWAKKHNTSGKLRMLADPNGDFITAMGLDVHLSTLGGRRAKRFSMIVTDNNVMELNVEPDSTGLSCSLASQLVYQKYIKSGEVIS